MSKIYEGDNKLNIVQVVGILANDMPESHKGFIKHELDKVGIEEVDRNPRKAFIHAAVEQYKYLAMQTEEEEKSKKYILHAINKYMKSSTIMDGEESVYRILCNNIMEQK